VLGRPVRVIRAASHPPLGGPQAQPPGGGPGILGRFVDGARGPGSSWGPTGATPPGGLARASFLPTGVAPRDASARKEGNSGPPRLRKDEGHRHIATRPSRSFQRTERRLRSGKNGRTSSVEGGDPTSQKPETGEVSPDPPGGEGVGSDENSDALGVSSFRGRWTQ